MPDTEALLGGKTLPAEWSAATLAEVTSKVGSGATPRGGSSVYTDSGVSFIRSQNVHDHSFKSDGLVYINDEAAHKLRGVEVAADDVLINITGDSILRTAIVDPSILPARVNQHVAIVRSNGKVDPIFLQKWLSLPAMKEYMLGHSSGGTRKAITKAHILSFPIPLPPLDEQKRIAASLGKLDEKIESNRRAQELAFALFKSLFLKAITSANKVTPLGDLVTITRGRSYKSVELAESDTALVTLKNVGRTGDYQPRGLKPYTGPYKVEQVVSPGEVIVAQTDLTQNAEVVGRAIRIPESRDYTTLVASLDLAVVRPVGNMSQEVLLGHLTYEPFRQHCRKHTTGTTVLHLAKDAIPTWTAPHVSDKAQSTFTETVRPLLSYMDKCGRENSRLASLRETLLPELLSGRIRTTEIEDTFEEAPQ